MDMSDSGMSMQGAFGPYAMNREASGTSWQPDSAPMEGLQNMSGPWDLMAQGYVTGAYTDQSGPRGDSQTFNESMLMLMGSRAVGDGVVSGRFMASLEPLDGPSGYPLLSDGRNGERSHPAH